MDASGWKAQLLPGARQRVANKIMDMLKRHLPASDQEGLHRLRRIVQSFEERIFTTATSQSDYLRKISSKMLMIEEKVQANNIPPNQVGPSINPLPPPPPTEQHTESQSKNHTSGSSKMLEGKAMVKETDMPLKMQIHAMDSASQALDLCDVSDCISIAAHIKKEFDSVYGNGWQCVVGSNFGCYFTHSPGTFIYFGLETLNFLIFKGTSS